MPEALPYAAFDVDGTIFKSSLAELIINQCVADGLFDETAFAQAAEYRRRWQHDNNEGVYQAYLYHLVGGFIAQIAGVEVDAFNAAAKRALDEHGLRRFGFPRQLADALRGTHRLVAISGSPDILVKPFLADLGFDEVYGTQLEAIDGRFTGKATPVGDKAEALKRLIAQGAVRQLGSVAFGDTISDFSMLDMADYPVAFNASRTLTNRAVAQQWPRVNEVKDQVTALVYDPPSDRYIEQDPRALIAEMAV